VTAIYWLLNLYLRMKLVLITLSNVVDFCPQSLNHSFTYVVTGTYPTTHLPMSLQVHTRQHIYLCRYMYIPDNTFTYVVTDTYPTTHLPISLHVHTRQHIYLCRYRYIADNTFTYVVTGTYPTTHYLCCYRYIPDNTFTYAVTCTYPSTHLPMSLHVHIRQHTSWSILYSVSSVKMRGDCWFCWY
jgi:hypothetical protein